MKILFLNSLLWLLSFAGSAQQLMWEHAFLHASSVGSEAALNVTITANQRVLISGPYSPSRPITGCRATYQSYYRLYTFGGTFLREQFGRDMGNGDSGFTAAGNGGWWVAPGSVCVGTTRYTRTYVQRITAQADTGQAWPLAAAPPRTSAVAVLVQRNRLLVAGFVNPTGNPNGQAQQFTLTCSDTMGNIRWQRSYARQPQALDYPTALLPTPRGGYLISGDGYVLPGYRHYLVETDSLGQFRRSRLLLPLGPDFPNGYRWNNGSNAIALPNAGGYLLSGTADSTVNGVSKNIGYVLRLDTALNVVWTYRHPPALAGTNATSNNAYRLRLLPNGTVGLLLGDVRNTGTPATYLVQLDVQTGQRVAFYILASNTQTAVTPYDWQWVGDGTLVLAGKSDQLGAPYIQSYLARHDFRGTPLAASRPRAGLASGIGLWAYPNPAQGATTLQVSGLGRGAGATVQVLDLAGRVVRTRPIAGNGDYALDLAGLPPGVYAGRLVAVTRLLGTCKIVVIR